ncbi:MAG: ATP-grasp domain-containing protein [Phycisphaerae bacterium]|jgi:biotin carboxylase
MATLLVLAAGVLQVPAITTAKRMGLRVVAADGSADAPGLKLADRHYVVDITDADACLALARQEKIDGVIHICAEAAMWSLGRINRELGLKGVDPPTALRATNKEKMRRAFEAGGAPSPRSIGAATEREALEAAEAIGRPLIVKPSRSSGSRGVTSLLGGESTAEFLRAFHVAVRESQDRSAVIEEFVEGPEFSVEILTWDGQPHVLQVTDKVTTNVPHFVETGHSQPTRQSPQARQAIEEAAVLGVKALGIDWAAAHAELRMTSRGPMLMEIGARLGGDYITTELVPRSTGIDMMEGAINLALGRVPDLTPRREPAGVAIRYFTPPVGKIGSIEGVHKARSMPGVKILQIDIAPGGTVPQLLSSLTRVGHVIVEGTTVEEAIARAEAARDAVTFTMAPLLRAQHILTKGEPSEAEKTAESPTLLVLAAGPLQVPAILTAKRMGLRVVAADGDPNAEGLRLADVSYAADIMDVHQCLEIALKEKISAVTHICSEVSNQVRGQLNDILGLNGMGYEVTVQTTNKERMRQAFQAGGAPCPKWHAVHTLDEALAAVDRVGRPVIFKPARNSGKRGITVLDGQASRQDLIEAFQYALRESRDPAVLVEEFVEGPEYSVETLTWDKQTHIIAITDKRTTGPPHCVETGHSIPTMLTGHRRRLVEETALQAIRAVGVDWAPCHVELKLTRRGPILMEIGARLGGGYITTELVPRATGIDMVEGAINLALGRQPDLRPRHPKRGSAIRFLWPSPGRVQAIEGLEETRRMPGVRIVELTLKVGDEVKEITSGPARVGHVITEGKDAKEAIARAEAARDAVKIITEPL